jgi:predicted nucleic acid-binding protein
MWNGAYMDVNKVSSNAVCDTGPLIHLDELGCLHLLNDFQEILIGPTVRNEVQRNRQNIFTRIKLQIAEGSPKTIANPTLLAMCRAFSLDAGETECLAIMERAPDALFLTDDAAARLVAERLGFKVHGTIGIILRSLRRRQMKLKEVLDILESVPLKSTLFIRPSLLEEIKLKVRHEFR